jgi:hypothetical protein
MAGRRYDASEWLEFLTEAPRVDEGTQELKDEFTEAVDTLAEKHGAAVGMPEDYDSDRLYYLTFASLMGHGVGLWEGDEPWHEAFEKKVEGAVVNVPFGGATLSDLAEALDQSAKYETHRPSSHDLDEAVLILESEGPSGSSFEVMVSGPKWTGGVYHTGRKSRGDFEDWDDAVEAAVETEREIYYLDARGGITSVDSEGNEGEYWEPED